LRAQIPEFGEKRSLETPALETAEGQQVTGEAALGPVAASQRALIWLYGATTRHRQALLLCSVLLICVVLLLHAAVPHYHTSLLDSAKAIYKSLVPLSWRIVIFSFKEHFLDLFANPYYYLGVAAVLTLQWLFPAKEDQGIFTVGLAQDFLYYLFISLVLVFAVGPFFQLIEHLYTKHLAFLTITAVASWPFAIRAAFGLVFNDLLHWTSHFLRHKIKPLWYCHMVHHSQREMNLFTDVRSHFIETFFALGLMTIPLNIFSVSFANEGWFYLIPVLYFRFYHASIKTNLGPLKHILVTPQSHRVHHSIEERHWDKNYGFIFTLWDRVFGTQYKNYDEYPDTGINELDFPHEKSFKGIFGTFFAQLVFPFRRLFQGRS